MIELHLVCDGDLVKYVTYDTRFCVTEIAKPRGSHMQFVVRDGKNNQLHHVGDLMEARRWIEEVLERETQ